MLKVICTLIGTFIGAGFASGKEIYLFFFKYNIYGILGIVISVMFMGFIIYKTLNISKNYNIFNYNNFLVCFCSYYTTPSLYIGFAFRIKNRKIFHCNYNKIKFYVFANNSLRPAGSINAE